MTCHDHGPTFAAKPCGSRHDGPCRPSGFLVFRRADVDALLAEFPELSNSGYWQPLKPLTAIVVDTAADDHA